MEFALFVTNLSVIVTLKANCKGINGFHEFCKLAGIYVR